MISSLVLKLILALFLLDVFDKLHPVEWVQERIINRVEFIIGRS